MVLSEYPEPNVRLSCGACGLATTLNKAVLLLHYPAEEPLPSLRLRVLGCALAGRELAGDIAPPGLDECRAYYPDLARRSGV